MTLPDWMLDPTRHCRGVHPDVMHPENTSGVAIAIAICKPPGKPACPFLDQCLQYAVKNAELHGVWGGQSMRKRVDMRRNGAPQKRGPKPGPGCRYNGYERVGYATEDEAWAASPQHCAYLCDQCGMWHRTTKRRAA